MWEGYIRIVVNTDIPIEKLADTWTAIKELGTQASDFPHKITQVRKRTSDNRACILRIELASEITRSQVVTKLANYLGYTEQQITNAIDEFYIFPGANIKERGRAANTYVCSNAADWGITEPET